MTKGTYAKGKNSKGKSHIYCRRCGNKSYHVSKKKCSYCGFGQTPKLKTYTWKKKV